MRCARTVMVLCLALVLPSCATIAGGGSNQAVTVQSTPAPASFTIQSSSGIQMAQGTTPTTVRLPRKNEYQIQITMPGYHPQTAVLTKGINGWIWGNLFVGWLVGFIVDFASGSAYKLEPSLVQVSLAQADDETYAIIRIYNAEKRLLEEKRLLMVPDTAAR